MSDKAKWSTATSMFVAGGVAGAVARTSSAPLDRIKLLFQVQAVASSGTTSVAYTGVGQAAKKILKEEGFLAFWKGNFTNVIRIFPYSACQLMAFDQYKRLFAGKDGDIQLWQRLASGAAAGMTATALTHPLDTLRLRLALPKHNYSGMIDAFYKILHKEGFGAFYKGLSPTLVGIAPYAALNFATYDLMKTIVYTKGESQSAMKNLMIGAVTGTFAATCCYPLDTVRRRMQMKGDTYNGQWHALATIWKTEGYRGFYKGWLANTLKVVPQNSIRFVTYEFMKKILKIEKRKTDT